MKPILDVSIMCTVIVIFYEDIRFLKVLMKAKVIPAQVTIWLDHDFKVFRSLYNHHGNQPLVYL